MASGVSWLAAFTQVDYFNNATIVELVERHHRGILAVLDEACSTAGPITDRIFLQTLDTHHRHHPHYSSRQVLQLSLGHRGLMGHAQRHCNACALWGLGGTQLGATEVTVTVSFAQSG